MVLSRLLQCYITLLFTSPIHSFSSPSTRRDVLESLQKISILPVATSLVSNINIANAVESTTPIEASWKAVDGLNSSDEGKFVSFDKSGEF